MGGPQIKITGHNRRDEAARACHYEKQVPEKRFR